MVVKKNKTKNNKNKNKNKNNNNNNSLVKEIRLLQQDLELYKKYPSSIESYLAIKVLNKYLDFIQR